MAKKQQKEAAVIERIRAAEQWRKSNYEEKWRQYFRQYRSQISQESRKAEGSNLFIPYTYMICEVIRARCAESLFASRPYVSVKPRGEGDKQKADATQTLLDWQLADRMHIDDIIRADFLENLCVFGTAIVYTGWRKKIRKEKRNAYIREPLDGVLGSMGQPMTFARRVVEEYKQVVYDDPEVVSIDLFDFFIDPTARSIESARFCGHREYRTRGDLEEMAALAGWKINWKLLSPESSMESGRQIRMEDAGKSIAALDTGLYLDKQDKSSLYKVHHYWEDNRHMVVVNETQVVLDEENPFWHGMKPYDSCTYAPLSNTFYGVGVCEMLEALQSELNTTRNMRIDYSAAALRRMWKLRKGSGLTPRDLIWRQNGVVQVENMDDLQEINIQSLPASAFSIEEGIKTDMKDVTGCHDIIMGLAASDETATTTMTKDNNASIRFKDVVNGVSKQILVPIAEKCLALDRQFLSTERTVRLLDEEDAYIVVSPDVFDSDYDLIYVGSAVEPMANQELNREKVLNAYQLLGNDTLYQNDPEAKIALINEMMKTLGFEDRQKLLPSIPALEGMTPLEEDDLFAEVSTPA